MRKILPFIILYAILIAACTPRVAAPTQRQSIALTDCALSSPNIPEQITAKCGLFTVPEDESNPQGRQIHLNVAVVPAIKRSPEPDPLFILVGGPGQSATEAFPIMFATFFRIHRDRDIVLVDQRGTGKSNPLKCMEAGDELLEEEQVIGLLKECPDQLNADLRFYTTDIAMRDLDSVRSALGYESINLYGASYGTRAALVYLKLYPERIRSIVLDAVVDPAFVLYQDAAQDGQRALDLFFQRCQTDEDCRSSYPDVRAEFEALLQKLEEQPMAVTIPHPVTGNPLQLTLTSTLLTNIVFNALYAPELVAMLPFAIHQAYLEDNYAPLITLAYLIDAGIYDGMFYAVACTEDAPLIAAGSDVQGIFENSLQTFVEVCTAWPHGEPPQEVHGAVASDVPVLMLSGEADPITPPWHAEQLASSLNNSLHIIFKGMGHGNSSHECTMRIMADFMERASTRGLDTSCVEKVEPPPFFVDFSGPQP